MITITHSDLLDAYRAGPLEGMGITFETCLQTPYLRSALEGAVRAQHMWVQQAHIRGSRYLEHLLQEQS